MHRWLDAHHNFLLILNTYKDDLIAELFAGIMNNSSIIIINKANERKLI